MFSTHVSTYRNQPKRISNVYNIKGKRPISPPLLFLCADNKANRSATEYINIRLQHKATFAFKSGQKYKQNTICILHIEKIKDDIESKNDTSSPFMHAGFSG